MGHSGAKHDVTSGLSDGGSAYPRRGGPGGGPRRPRVFRLTLLGVGAMASPRFAPAGLLVEYGSVRVMFDGGPGAEPGGRLDAWLITDERAELISKIRALARAYGVEPAVAPFSRGGLDIQPREVQHTSRVTYGYLIAAEGRRIAWAPEFHRVPGWVRDVDLLFADAAGWRRRILFAGGDGGHAAALEVAEKAQRMRVGRLFAHIGRPTLRAIDAGVQPPFGEFGREGARFYPRRR